MPVTTLHDAATFHAHMHQKIVGRVEAATPDARTWRPGPGKWSPLEHLEHVARSEVRLLAQMEAMAEQARAQGLTLAADAPRQVDALPALLAAGAVGNPKVAPAASQPTGLSFDEIKAMLAASRARHQALLATLVELDTDRVRQVIPVAEADCNLGQWYHFAGLHIALHDGHIKDVLAAYAAAH
jgi:hypothetical protein